MNVDDNWENLHGNPPEDDDDYIEENQNGNLGEEFSDGIIIISIIYTYNIYSFLSINFISTFSLKKIVKKL